MKTIKNLDTGIAGNVTTSIIVGAEEFRTFLYGQLVLTTDGTVANRRVIFSLTDDSDNVILDSHAGAVVTASQSDMHHEFMQGIFRETSFVGSAIQMPIPIDTIIPTGYKIKLSVENGVAGDSYDYALLSKTTDIAPSSMIVA